MFTKIYNTVNFFVYIFSISMKIINLNNIGNSYRTLPASKKCSSGYIQKDSFEKSKELNFCAKDLYNVNLMRRSTKKLLKSRVVQLEHTSCDELLMLNLLSFWRDTRYCEPMIKDYFSRICDNFYIVVLGDKKEIKACDVKSFLQMHDQFVKGQKQCELVYVQAAPEIANNPKSSIKGAGEIALYSVVKYAKDHGCKKVTLLSANNGFYEKIGFEMGAKTYYKSSNRDFYLEEKDYDQFLKRVEKKYGF